MAFRPDCVSTCRSCAYNSVVSESRTPKSTPVVAAGSRSYVLLVAVGCVALVVLLLLDRNVAAAAAKVVSSTAFLALAVRVGALGSAYGRIILLGLAFSWFGDVFLTGESQTAFLAGLVAFLLAHCAYIAAFVVRGISRHRALWVAIPIALAAIAVSVWLTPYLPSELQVPVRVYTAVISLMVVAALGTHGRTASTYIVAGAVLFFLSDLSVAALRLVQTEFPTYVWGLPSYYAGQVCLALGSSNARS